MSNHLAIATVTAVLSERVGEAAQKGVGGATVNVGRPDRTDDQDAKPIVNLFLYQVTPNATARNAHLPTRSGNGNPIARPTVALDLHYLLSFYGSEKKYEPERMLGAVVRAMESRPILDRGALKKISEDDVLLTLSDLHDATELVKVTPTALNLEELSKLWSVFFQVPYALSVAYQLTYVTVESDVRQTPSLPVTEPSIAVVPFGGPQLLAVEALDDPRLPIRWDDTVRIRGSGLAANGMGLRVGDTDATMAQATVSPDEIELPLKTTSFGGKEVAAGIQHVRAVLPPAAGAPAHMERLSSSVPLVLRTTPTFNAIDTADGKRTLLVDFAPKVQKGQEVHLLLDQRVADPPPGLVLAHETVADADYPITTLRFPLEGVSAATYLMRAQVDDVQSVPTMELDPTNPAYRQITGPEVVVP